MSAAEGKRGLTVTFGRENAKKNRDEAAAAEAVTSKVGELFARLGGTGRLTIFRLVDGEERYCKSVNVTEELADNLEETIAKLCGGGTFTLRGFNRSVENNKTVCVGYATLHIDDVVHPPRQTEREKERDGDKAKQLPPEVTTLLSMYERQARQAREDAAARESSQQAQSSGTTTLMLQQMKLASDQAIAMQQNNTAMMLALLNRPAGGQAPAGGLDISGLQTAAKFLESFGFKPAGAQAAADERSFGERLLENPLTRIADKVGDKVGERIASMVADEQNANKPAPAPIVTTATPVASPPAAAPVKPQAGALVKLPPGAKPLSEEQLAELRKSGKLKQPPRPPTAPRAADVLPTEKKD